VPYLTNETLFRFKETPRHLVVIVGGPVGIEMAQAFRRLGSEVTVIEAARALGKDDPDLAAVVLDRLRSEGVEIIENARVTAVEPQGASGVRVLHEGGEGSGRIDSSTLLLAAGRMPNVEGLGLEKAGIAHGEHGITVGANLRTTNRRVYAIGDVVGGLQFTHVAGYHAGLVVQQILFRIPARVNRDVIPWAIYTDPPLAHVGLAEEEARRRHRSVRVLRRPYAENDRAQAERRTEGLVKIVTNRRGRILGTSIVGADADEMINIWALAVSKRMTVADIRSYVAPYPTLAEIGKRAALTYYDPLTRKPFVRMAVRLLRRLG
jgi:pyruvate/2-oxoglutarate dehydrogenase complex dihydrolipoamide dehydrogenase (E3) component